MQFTKLFILTFFVVFTAKPLFAHQSECQEQLNSNFNRPCLERLIPRSLDPLNRNMIQPEVVKFSGEDLGSGPLAEDIQPLIVVIGASGRTGKLVLEGLAKRDLRIRALSRDTAKASADIGGNYEWVQADVTQPETLVMALQDSDIIISTIGAKPGKGPDGPESVVYKGVINLVDEAKRAGTRHIIYMSSIGAGGSQHFSTVFLNLFMNKTMKWKSLGEEYIRNSGIDFTIVRPGGLYGDPGTQGIKFDQGDKIIGAIPRGDVASVLVESVYNPDAINKTFEIINDESLPLDAWKDEFKNLKTGEYGKIQSGRLPFSYWGSVLILVLLVVLLIRRRRRRKRAA